MFLSATRNRPRFLASTTTRYLLSRTETSVVRSALNRPRIEWPDSLNASQLSNQIQSAALDPRRTRQASGTNCHQPKRSNHANRLSSDTYHGHDPLVFYGVLVSVPVPAGTGQHAQRCRSLEEVARRTECSDLTVREHRREGFRQSGKADLRVDGRIQALLFRGRESGVASRFA